MALNQSLEDNTDRILPIVIDDLNQSESDLLQYVLSRKTYMKWSEKYFFQKLRYAMERETPVLGLGLQRQSNETALQVY